MEAYSAGDFTITTLQRYKPLPALEELDPGYEPGWLYDVLILQAEPDDKIGSIIMAEETKADEAGASIVALVVAVSRTAFRNQDWESVAGGDRPYSPGDVCLTKRYPAGCYVQGRDGRRYMMVKDVEIIGKRDARWAAKQAAAA